MKRLAIVFWTVVVVCAAIGAPADGAIVYSGSQNVALALDPMSRMVAKTIPLGGMSADWDDFRVELWLDMGMPGGMMMDMGTRLLLYAPRGTGMSMGAGMNMGSGMGMDMGMPGGILSLQGLASKLSMGAGIGGDSFFDIFVEIPVDGAEGFGQDGGYLGLRTAMGQFGWLHMSRQSNMKKANHTVVFDGWAYEDLPGIGIAAGETGGCDWKPGYPYKMHWPQLPDLGSTGIDIALTQMTLADDFRCTATGPIRDIHIWGSFYQDVLPKDGLESLTFELSIHSDIPATDNRWSQPGNKLWTRTFKPGEYTVRRIHDGPEDWYEPATGRYISANHRYAFQYNFCIGRDAFKQEEGKIYWLAIRETSVTTSYSFGWKTAVPASRWNDDAVYLQSGWAEMAYPKGHRYARESLDLAFVITDGSEPAAQRDLGDAPDSSNSVGFQMLAYPGVAAHFPTVFGAGSPPHGPMHLYPRDMYYLGKWVSLETDADVGIDDDGVTNIDPLTGAPDRDGADDGLVLPANVPFCQSTTLDYVVTMTGAPPQRPYVNVWCDWNRDGDWDDKVICPDGAEAPEWAVQNQVIALAAPGTSTFTTPSFRSWHPTKDRIDPMWLRISITERPWASTSAAPSAAGSGPATGYKYGETEDYYLQPKDMAPPARYDWGDAPTGTIAPGYPTIAFNNGARHVIAGPWLGNAKDTPDAEADGQPETDALGDDSNGNDDENGVSLLPLFPGLPAAAVVEVNGGGGVVQAWIDFNGDKSWQNSEKVFDGFLPDGVHTINFTTPGAALLGQTFARVRISTQGGLSPEGAAKDGEVEDHRLWIVEQPVAAKQWCQRPDLTPEGIDIRIDNGENLPRMAADDFECRQPGRLTHIRLWGSWKDDKKGQLKKIRLRIHPDDPVGSEGADTKNKYSKPGPETLWEWEFLAGQFTETLHHTVEIVGEWWWDPAAGDAIPGGDKKVWQLDMNVPADKEFLQEGTSAKPRIYWLEVSTETADGQFGWKTRRWPDHFMDDAVWYGGFKVPPEWHEMRYPYGHKYYHLERNSIDMAFCLSFTADGTQPTSQAASRTQCPAVKTVCPVLNTSCPATDTQCPATDTQCPPIATQCPPVVTDCSGAVTRCPPVETQCPTTETKCPPKETQCPPVQTKCPPKVTQCTPTQCPVETQCPVILTQCTPTRCPVETVCPQFTTRCPKEDTRCPEETTRCPPVQTQCPPLPTECVATNCPVVTVCPPKETSCPITVSVCGITISFCPPAPTQCPGPVTECPGTLTMCSPKCGGPGLGSPLGQASLLLGSACPTVETDCPTVDHYLAMAQGGR